MPSDRAAAFGRWRSSGAARDDLVAALVVAVLLIPQSLAYAILAGLPPQVGVYATLLPMLAYAAFGSSTVNSVGPVAVVALMTGQAIAGLGTGDGGPSRADIAVVLAAESGLLLLAAAVLKLDALAALLSTPVLTGFSTGAALTIALSQAPALLGSGAKGYVAPEVLRSWWADGRLGHAETAAYGLGALVLLLAVRRWGVGLLAHVLPRPRAQLAVRLLPLAVIVAAIAVAAATDAGPRGVALVGALPPFQVPLRLPPLEAALWWQLLPSAAGIALVAYVSSLAVAESMALRRRERVNARREMAGLAAANLAAGFGAGMPVGGSFSRTAVNADSGARTRAAGALAALFMGAAMLAAAAPLALLPRAVLAATIVIAVLSVVEWSAFGEAWRYSRAEAATMVAVGVVTFFATAEAALALGVLLSVGLLLRQSATPHVARIGRVGESEHYRNVERHAVQCTPGVLALRIDESLIFTNARRLPDLVTHHLEALPDTHRVVLLMSPVNRIDLSGLDALRALHDALAARGIRLDLTEVKGPVLDALKAGGWERWFRGRIYLSHHQGMVDTLP
jgi:SulP family sulfate permease